MPTLWLFPADFPSAMADAEDGRSPSSRSCLRRSVYGLMLLSLLLFASTTIFSSTDTRGTAAWQCPYCDLTLSNTAAVAGSADAPAASPEPTALGEIVFAISGSAATWERRQQYCSLWWRPGEMRGHVWLDAAPAGTWPATSPPYRVSSVNAKRYGTHAAAARLARVVADAYEAAQAGGDGDGREVRWFVMGDDDTVFFPDNLAAALGKYDHREMRYVGAPSESVEQNERHSYSMAFGGGGFALSYPAAAALSGIMDGCLERYNGLHGSDERIHGCLAELGVPLTREDGFHQLDLRGNVFGLLATHPIAPLVSLHHLDYIDPIFPRHPTQLDAVGTLVNVSRLDPGRTLQQVICYAHGSDFSWSVSVSWGYAVRLHPRLLMPLQLQVPLQTFRTWRSVADGPFVFNTRPVATNPPCNDAAATFFLDSVGERGQNGVNWTVTSYKREKSKGKSSQWCTRPGARAASKVDIVKVFALKLDPAIWKRAPRRQCCITRRTKGGRVLAVRIYGCKSTESAYHKVNGGTK